MNNFQDIKKIEQIPGFPYKSFKEMKVAVEDKEVTVGAAMDFARQWIANEGRGITNFQYWYVTLLSMTYILLPLVLVAYSLITGKFELLWYVLPLILSFLILRPSSIRISLFFSGIIWIGYGLIVCYFLNILPQWSLLLGLSIALPWLINKHIYNFSVHHVVQAGLKSEKVFVEMFKYDVLALQFSNNKMIWGYQLMKQDNSEVDTDETANNKDEEGYGERSDMFVNFIFEHAHQSALAHKDSIEGADKATGTSDSDMLVKVFNEYVFAYLHFVSFKYFNQGGPELRDKLVSWLWPAIFEKINHEVYDSDDQAFLRQLLDEASEADATYAKCNQIVPGGNNPFSKDATSVVLAERIYDALNGEGEKTKILFIINLVAAQNVVDFNIALKDVEI